MHTTKRNVDGDPHRNRSRGPVPASPEPNERAKEREIGRRQVEQANALDDVTKRIWGGKTEADKITLAKKALGKGIQLPDESDVDSEAALIAKKKSEAALREFLRRRYLDQAPEMLNNLKN